MTSIRVHQTVAPAPAEQYTNTYSPPHEPANGGWLGQVPPPPPPAEHCHHHEREEPSYAIPGLAPDPWLEPAPLYPHDPTLFG